jgi:capsule polysaccharide export protein KpsE/RkpR
MTANQPVAFDLSFLRSRAVLRRIAAITVACAVLGTLYALLTPKWYSSVLAVVPAKAEKPGISSLLGGQLGGLASGLDASLGSSTEAPRIAAVLQSIALSDAVIQKFDLRTRYKEKYLEGARTALWSHCGVKTLPKASLVQLSCEDKDPRFVQEMLTYFADYGNQIFRRVSVSSATEEVRFLEKRVTELRQQADDTSARMREFQEKHKIVDIDTQAKAVVSAMAALNRQRISRQLELDYARTFSSGDEPTTQQLESQVSVMGDRLRDLEEAPPAAPGTAEKRSRRGSEPGMFPAALAVPKLRADFEKLLRDRKVAEVTLVVALERLEGAKANEARDVSTFVVLDPPALPTRKSRPHGFTILVLSTIFGFAVSLAYEWWRSTGGLAALRAVFGYPPSEDPASSDTPERPVALSESRNR